MALSTLQTTDVFYFQSIFRVRMNLNQLIIISIAFGGDFGLSVTVYTPPHGKRTMLSDNFHFLDRTMTSLAFDLSHYYVLRVIEISQIRKIVNPHPLDRLIIINRIVDFLNFGRNTFFAC